MANETSQIAIDVVFNTLVKSLEGYGSGLTVKQVEALAAMTVEPRFSKGLNISDTDKQIVQAVLLSLAEAMRAHKTPVITVDDLKELMQINKDFG